MSRKTRPLTCPARGATTEPPRWNTWRGPAGVKIGSLAGSVHNDKYAADPSDTRVSYSIETGRDEFGRTIWQEVTP